MCELQALLQQLLELAKSNPEVLFKITPNHAYGGWEVEFLKGGFWWGVTPEGEDTLIDVIKEALAYFERLTDEVMQSELAKNKE